MERFDCIVVGCDWDHFPVGVHLRELSSSRVHGGGRGWLSYLSSVKRMVFVSLSKFSLKWVTKGGFARSFRVLSKKKICQEILGSLAVVSITAFKILKVSINVFL